MIKDWRNSHMRCKTLNFKSDFTAFISIDTIIFKPIILYFNVYVCSSVHVSIGHINTHIYSIQSKNQKISPFCASSCFIPVIISFIYKCFFLNIYRRIIETPASLFWFQGKCSTNYWILQITFYKTEQTNQNSKNYRILQIKFYKTDQTNRNSTNYRIICRKFYNL